MPKYKGEHITMWKLIPLKLMPPTISSRYCCAVLKETGCPNRYIATGVRWVESQKRQSRSEFEKFGSSIKTKEYFSTVMLMNDNDAKRRMTEHCMQQKKMVVNPIIDWKDSDIWEFINSEHIETCELYKCGYDRVGCIGCPMAGTKRREAEFTRWPKYKQLYLNAFERMLEERKRRRKLDGSWRMVTTAEDVFLWWMEYDVLPGQASMEDFQ